LVKKITLSRESGMMNTPQLAAVFLGVAILDAARLAARWFMICFSQHFTYPQVFTRAPAAAQKGAKTHIFG
jgi:hypothetical protein